ncbi:membrane protein [Legionella norrlandica]|uniref:Membrane protein n=1 Tax=Legionella norrlandica TaxID=1498499 RepID=A0A0A2STZ8_9GAMM|nr:efflux RND transporter periplasmic adaptor subunit [Legionella norrlandica]KGP63201.1 membrane protein [Legionella norrlandica]
MKKYLSLLIVALVLITVAWLIRNLWLIGTVKVVHPIYGNAVQAVYATGTVEPTVMMPIAAQNSARLIQLNVDEGSRVVKGQILAQLEDEHLQQNLKELIEHEKLTKIRYERNAKLIGKGVISKDEYDRTLSEWQAARAAVHRLEAQISYLRLIAPADGLIIKRDGEVGQLISANQAVFWLSCCAPLRITAEVDEEDIVQVKTGQKVLIRSDAFPNQIFYGVVQSITPKGDPIARSYRVRINFTKNNPLLIGMTAEINIIAHEKKNALLLPVSSVIGNTIWRVEDGKLTQSTVTVGAKGLKQVEILKGASVNDLIVLQPNNELEQGQKVRFILVKQDE